MTSASIYILSLLRQYNYLYKSPQINMAIKNLIFYESSYVNVFYTKTIRFYFVQQYVD